MTEIPSGWERVADYLRTAGVELEKAMRAAGTPLAPGVTGEQMLWSFLDQSRDYVNSEEGKRRGAELLMVMNRLREQYPKAFGDPAFQTAFQDELKRLYGEGANPGGASA